MSDRETQRETDAFFYLPMPSRGEVDSGEGVAGGGV
jgi:hypothetical protein